MKRILLTTTSLVLAAGVASAETSISWSGTATAGVAREGVTAAVAAGAVSAAADKVHTDGAAGDSTNANAAASRAQFLGEILVDIDAIGTSVSDANGAVITTAGTGVDGARTDLAALTIEAARSLNAADLKAVNLLIAAASDQLDYTYGTASAAKTKAGDFRSYSELNATVKGSVTADNGITITASVSVDAGEGYDFADDDDFDTTGVSLRGGLDNVTIATAMGTFKIDQDAVTHLVDGDDDVAADLLYTNTFGSMSISAAIDLNKDGDDTAKKAVAGSTTGSNANASNTTFVAVAGTAAVAADVAWSAKISMPVAGGSAYVAMDEEGGNIFGASTTLSGVGISFSSKLEALEEEISADRENNIGLTYAMGATTLGASWNSKEDGDQWGISAAYAADGLSISASTDEGSDWSVSGSMALGGGASAVAGVNYTEDAYLGLSFAF